MNSNRVKSKVENQFAGQRWRAVHSAGREPYRLAIAAWTMLLACSSLAICSHRAAADDALPPILQGVGIDQNLGKQVPLDLPFRDERGRAVQLGDYVHDKPVVLVLAYFRCPRLCTEVLNGLEDGLEHIGGMDVGNQFNVLTVSFDPLEKPPLATAKKAAYIEKYNRPGAAEGWHFLTGDSPAIHELTEAVGFHYHYDPVADQFAHASGIMVLTPQGKLARYFYGIHYPATDLRLALVEASSNKIGSPVDQLLLFCFHYDPVSGKYTPAIMNLIRLGGGITLLGLVVLIAALRREERRRQALAGQAPSVANDVA
jgi:protein SCO1/2